MEPALPRLWTVAWERMWADLSALAEQRERDADLLEAADRLRVEHATIGWLDRARACSGRRLTVWLPSGRTVVGELVGCGADWLALRADSAALLVVPAAAVRQVEGLGSHTVPPEALGAVGRAGDLRLLLRRLAAGGEPVVVGGTGGLDVRGVPGRVGRDHLDIHGEDGRVRTVPLAAVERLVLS